MSRNRAWRCAAFGVAALLAAVTAAAARKPPQVALWRLDCGLFVEKGFVDSCYLVRHGDSFLLWDAGLDGSLAGQGPRRIQNNLVALDAALAQQLATIGVRPDQISRVALSHAHFDHVGQAAAFPRATLLIGRQDWESLHAVGSESSVYSRDRLAPWIAGRAKVDPVEGDRDVFGDGSVVMVAAPGHSPGHHILLVRLKRSGPVLLSGDLWTTERQRRESAVSPHNPDPAATRASYAKVEWLARRLKARIVIGHDPVDIASLPEFPAQSD